MENRVGSNVPTPAKLATLLKNLDDAVNELAKFGVILSKEERKRLIRARRDSEPMQRLVHALATKKKLSLSGFSLADLLDDMNLVQAMEPFAQVMARGEQLTSDTLLQADTEAWQAFLAYYGVLSSMAERDPELATELAPVVAFMKTGRRKPEPEPAKDPKAPKAP